jgi:hypothetical protein
MTTLTNDIEALAVQIERHMGDGENGWFEMPDNLAFSILTALRAQDAVPVASDPDYTLLDLLETFVDAGFATVSRNPSDYESTTAWRHAIRLAYQAGQEIRHPSPNPAPQAVAADGGLLPCPFCESENARRPMQDVFCKWIVGCEDCGAEGPQAETPEEANDAWNQRPTAPNGDKDAVIARESVRVRYWRNRAAALREALEPFASFAATFIDDEGWVGPMNKERIVDWFGPSDFRKAALANRGEAV